MAVAIQIRRDSALDWTTADPILAVGEMGIETDTNKAKYGDGVTVWSSLPYFIDDTGTGGDLPAGVNAQTLRYGTDWESTSDLVVTDAGNVGVGISNPSIKLQVVGDAGTLLRVTDNLTQTYNLVVDNGSGTPANGGLSHQNPNTGYQAWSTSGLERMRISSNGFVGIGTSDPLAALHTVGAAIVDSGGAGYSFRVATNFGDTMVSLQAGNTVDDTSWKDRIKFDGFGQRISFWTSLAGNADVERMNISSAGLVQIQDLAGAGTRMVVAGDTGVLSTQAIPGSGTGTLPDGTVAGQVLYWDGAANWLANSALTIEALGNVGVANLDPAFTLDVGTNGETPKSLAFSGQEMISGRGARASNMSFGEGALAVIDVDGVNIPRHNYGFGVGALPNMTLGYYNMAFGLDSMYALNGGDGTAGTNAGTRNHAFGHNTLRFNEAGFSNIAFGRNAGQAITSDPGDATLGSNNVTVGSASMAAIARTGADNTTIINEYPLKAKTNTCVGTEAGRYSIAAGNTLIGNKAGFNAGIGSLTAVGDSAGELLNQDVFFNGNQIITQAQSGSFSKSGNDLLCVTGAPHGYTTGFFVQIDFEGANASGLWMEATVTSTTAFTVTSSVTPSGLGATGTFTIDKHVNTATAALAQYNVAVGELAMGLATGGSFNTATGRRALQRNITGDQNVALGQDTLTFSENNSNMTALGSGALRLAIDGSNIAAQGWTNTTGVGANARASGNNEVNLGSSSTLTYVYGSVQQRSDLRDKTDVRDTVLGMDFINSLRPVDFKYNYRESDEPGTRYHHGLIAQEVEQVIRDTGVDFGGFNDSKVKGGADVLSLGYDELIAPLIKSVQELSARVKELEAAH